MTPTAYPIGPPNLTVKPAAGPRQGPPNLLMPEASPQPAAPVSGPPAPAGGRMARPTVPMPQTLNTAPAMGLNAMPQRGPVGPANDTYARTHQEQAFGSYYGGLSQADKEAIAKQKGISARTYWRVPGVAGTGGPDSNMAANQLGYYGAGGDPRGGAAQEDPNLVEARIKQAAKEHFLANILPHDPAYAQHRQAATDAQMATKAGMSVESYLQAKQQQEWQSRATEAQVSGAENQARKTGNEADAIPQKSANDTQKTANETLGATGDFAKKMNDIANNTDANKRANDLAPYQQALTQQQAELEQQKVQQAGYENTPEYRQREADLKEQKAQLDAALNGAKVGEANANAGAAQARAFKDTEEARKAGQPTGQTPGFDTQPDFQRIVGTPQQPGAPAAPSPAGPTQHAAPVMPAGQAGPPAPRPQAAAPAMPQQEVANAPAGTQRPAPAMPQQAGTQPQTAAGDAPYTYQASDDFKKYVQSANGTVEATGVASFGDNKYIEAPPRLPEEQARYDRAYEQEYDSDRPNWTRPPKAPPMLQIHQPDPVVVEKLQQENGLQFDPKTWTFFDPKQPQFRFLYEGGKLIKVPRG